MKPLKAFASILSVIVLATTMGCAASRTHEGTGQYLDDSVITTKVKASILNEPGLKVSEINVETFKGVVQLSGFVSSRADIDSAIAVARRVNGVKSVSNKMQLK
jgi:osmotically-inducible protein OsmY